MTMQSLAKFSKELTAHACLQKASIEHSVDVPTFFCTQDDGRNTARSAQAFSFPKSRT